MRKLLSAFIVVLLLLAILTACGGGGGGSIIGSTNPTYTVTYNDNGSTGGSVPVASTNYEAGQTVTVLGNTGNLVKTGYSFSGWNTQADGSGTTYAQAQTFTMGTAKVSLYAKWTGNPTYTLTYNGNGSTGGSVPVDSTNYEQGQTITVLANTGNLVKTNYSFSGWNTQADGSGTTYTQGQTFTMGMANVTLYAKWKLTGTAVSVLMGGSIQGSALNLIDNVSTFAGVPPGSTDAIGAAARFWEPYGITTDGTNLYVADTYNNTIRKIVIATGQVTTLAGTAGTSGSTDGTGAAARFWNPFGISTDGTNLYVADTYNNTIRKIVIATGQVTTIAGTAGINGSTNGTGAAARFWSPYGITTDNTNLYVADSYNNTVRKIVIATGQVTTIAGTAGINGSTNGIGAAASFSYPVGITTDTTNLYVADYGNNTIRKIVIATGQVTTLAGTAGTLGSSNGTGAAASFYNPSGITTDGTNLYVTDNGNNTIRKIVIATGQVTTLAGTAGTSGSTDGIGAAARFGGPQGITTDNTNLYVADTYNNTIRKIVTATSQVTTLAGSITSGSADGIGAAASFYSPSDITTDGANLYVADTYNNNIRKIVIATGQVTTLAGSITSGSADGIGAAARFMRPYGITTDGTNLYVADFGNGTIRKIAIATGQVTTLAGTAGTSGSTDGTGAAASFGGAIGITTDNTNLYVTDSGNHTIRKIVIATGQVTTLAGTAGTSGSTDGIGAAASFNFPTGITTDGTDLYVADANNGTIRKIVIATGQVTTFAGTEGTSGSTDGIGAAASFNSPDGITTNGTNLYVADDGNSTIRKIAIATGQVTTLAGTVGINGSTNGTGAAARFNYPTGITTDGTDLYVADFSNSTIRLIQ